MKIINSAKDRLIDEISKLHGNFEQKAVFKTGILESLRIDELNQKSAKTPQSGTEQYQVLRTMQINCEALLKNLQPLQHANSISIEYRDLLTGALIRKSVDLLNREKMIAKLKESSKSNDLRVAVSKFSQLKIRSKDGKKPEIQ